MLHIPKILMTGLFGVISKEVTLITELKDRITKRVEIKDRWSYAQVKQFLKDYNACQGEANSSFICGYSTMIQRAYMTFRTTSPSKSLETAVDWAEKESNCGGIREAERPIFHVKVRNTPKGKWLHAEIATELNPLAGFGGYQFAFDFTNLNKSA